MAPIADASRINFVKQQHTPTCRLVWFPGKIWLASSCWPWASAMAGLISAAAVWICSHQHGQQGSCLPALMAGNVSMHGCMHLQGVEPHCSVIQPVAEAAHALQHCSLWLCS